MRELQYAHTAMCGVRNRIELEIGEEAGTDPGVGDMVPSRRDAKEREE